MAVTPTWQAATSGQAASAGHVNQFLGTHSATVLYAATQKAAQTTAGSTSTSTNGLYLAQSFATQPGQTTIGYVSVPITTTTSSGASLATTTLSLYANSGSAPTGSPLISTTLTAEYAYQASGAGTATVNVIYPLPIAGLTASTTYWLVLAAAGNVSHSYSWYRSNQTSGASTSANGTTWAAQTYGLMYAIFDQTASGHITAMWEDSGARWTTLGYVSNGEINTVAEYTAGQTAAGYLQSYRLLSYTNGVVTGVA
jgi:hypothetical protein